MSTLKEILDSRFGGVISRRKHEEYSGKACALELLSLKKGIPFTDEPGEVRCFDFRFINDMQVSDKLRTEWMLKMLEAYEDSLDWKKAKQKKVAERIIISTVNQLIADVPRLPEEVANQCKAVKTLEEAKAAALAVLRATVTANVGFSIYATSAARTITNIVVTGNIIVFLAAVVCDAACVACNCVGGHATAVFIKACNIWLEAAKD